MTQTVTLQIKLELSPESSALLDRLEAVAAWPGLSAQSGLEAVVTELLVEARAIRGVLDQIGSPGSPVFTVGAS